MSKVYVDLYSLDQVPPLAAPYYEVPSQAEAEERERLEQGLSGNVSGALRTTDIPETPRTSTTASEILQLDEQSCLSNNELREGQRDLEIDSKPFVQGVAGLLLTPRIAGPDIFSGASCARESVSVPVGAAGSSQEAEALSNSHQ
jgi:hypothetical protein